MRSKSVKLQLNKKPIAKAGMLIQTPGDESFLEYRLNLNLLTNRFTDQVTTKR